MCIRDSYRYAINERDYERGREVADPIRLYDASPIGDGAAALLLLSLIHI